MVPPLPYTKWPSGDTVSPSAEKLAVSVVSTGTAPLTLIWNSGLPAIRFPVTGWVQRP